MRRYSFTIRTPQNSLNSHDLGFTDGFEHDGIAIKTAINICRLNNLEVKEILIHTKIETCQELKSEKTEERVY